VGGGGGSEETINKYLWDKIVEGAACQAFT
jgi:hypothetical protein